jgi:hypothetical protein
VAMRLPFINGTAPAVRGRKAAWEIKFSLGRGSRMVLPASTAASREGGSGLRGALASRDNLAKFSPAV